MTRTVIYLSGPITGGDREQNFAQAAAIHRHLMQRGFAVINPMLTMKLPWAWEVEHMHWIEADLPIIERVDAVFRLPGQSVGADLEEAHANKCGVPVFRTVGDLLAWQTEREQPMNILQEADLLTAGDRQRDYDHPLPNHQRIARLWNAYLDCRREPEGRILPEDVATMMILLKIARHVFTRKRDNLVDICGYARCLERMADDTEVVAENP